MAQSELTVTPPSPTPPTNIVNVGATGPNPATFDPTIYVSATGDDHYPRPSLAPYYDDSITQVAATANSVNENIPASGTTASPQAFAAKKAALLVGGTSADHEGLGTETVVTATSANPSPAGQLKTVSSGPAETAATRAAGPNASHSSSDSVAPASAPTITGLLPVAPVSNANGSKTTLTVNGTNFRNGAVVLIGGVPYQTQYNSATQLKVLNAPMRTTAGNTPITVKVGATTTAATNWVFS